jgi:hypothetical protein
LAVGGTQKTDATTTTATDTTDIKVVDAATQSAADSLLALRDRTKRKSRSSASLTNEAVDESPLAKRTRTEKADASPTVTKTPNELKVGRLTLRLSSIQKTPKSTPSRKAATDETTGKSSDTPVTSTIKAITLCIQCLKTTAPETLTAKCPDKQALISRKAFITCASCQRKYHQLCAGLYTPRVAAQAPLYGWQCRDCKRCIGCNKSTVKDSMVICAGCDRGWHTKCRPNGTARVSKGEYHILIR